MVRPLQKIEIDHVVVFAVVIAVVTVVEVFRLAFGRERGSQEVLLRLSWPERPSCRCHFGREVSGSPVGPRKC